jgi:hypothetical protein
MKKRTKNFSARAARLRHDVRRSTLHRRARTPAPRDVGLNGKAAREAPGDVFWFFFSKTNGFLPLSCLIAQRTVFKMTSAKPGDMARRLG